MLLLASDLTVQVQTWQGIFGGGPLAAFLGLTITAIVALFTLFIWTNRKLQQEQASHLETVRTVVALSAAMERTWSDNLRRDSDASRSWDAAMALQKEMLETLSRSVAIAEWLKTQPATTRTPP